MSKNNKNQQLIDLLKLNDNSKLHEWLISKGKSAKPYAAVTFIKKDKKEAK